MPHVAAKIPADLHLAIIDAVRAGGKPAELRPNFGDISEGTINELTLHVTRGDKRDLARASILERLKAGEYLPTIASLENCSVTLVARIAHSWRRELDACERLSAMKAPRQQKPTPRRGLSDAAIVEIRERAAAGASDRELAKTFGITAGYVAKIRAGVYRGDLQGPRSRKAKKRN